jgi:hypothetical protein
VADGATLLARRVCQPSVWLGIDFSGNWRMWSAGRSTSNIWIAAVRREMDRLVLVDLRPVQHLTGRGEPFQRLVLLLASGEFDAAGIDAPFSVPRHRVPGGAHAELLRRVAAWDRRGRPFASAACLVSDLVPEGSARGVKELRATECDWQVNVRSTTWAGPRGGAPMTVACLTLLGAIGRPIWPFAQSSSTGLIVEAFPAAQLKAWRLPHERYNGSEGPAATARAQIVDGLQLRVDIAEFAGVLRANADALDAVICCFAGLAVTAAELARLPGDGHELEGAIAVHR